MLVALLVKTTAKVALAALIVSSSGTQESETHLRSNGVQPDKTIRTSFNAHTYKLLAANVDNIKSGAEDKASKSDTDVKEQSSKTDSASLETRSGEAAALSAETTEQYLDPDSKEVKAKLKASLLSTPEELERAVNANRLFTGKVRGSMCISCLKTLRKDILAKDGVMTVDVVVLQRTKDGSEPEPKVLRIGPDDPPVSDKQLKKMMKEADAQTPREASISIKYIDNKLSAADLKRTIKSHDFRLATFSDGKITRRVP
ncbi:MAG: hypothetical protein K2Z81_10640 [Cyanobacteria bacterium]|nr:hypothetical protein [Cyanobacteriota bacterium]